MSVSRRCSASARARVDDAAGGSSVVHAPVKGDCVPAALCAEEVIVGHRGALSDQGGFRQ